MTHPPSASSPSRATCASTCGCSSGLGVRALAVRRPAELEGCDGLVIPGGESTTMAKLARTFELFEPLQKRIAGGMPTFGTCAGMILLADRILDGTADQETLGGLDITVRRNAFGRQVDSFEGDLAVPGDRRARCTRSSSGRPWVEQVGAGVEVLARVEHGEAAGRIVAVRQGPLLATSFHPEVGGDVRIHRYFVDQIVHARRKEQLNVRPLQVGDDQAQEGRHRLPARQDVRQAGQEHRGRRADGRRRPRRATRRCTTPSRRRRSPRSPTTTSTARSSAAPVPRRAAPTTRRSCTRATAPTASRS